MATGNKFNQFIADVYNGVHNFSSDTVKAYLTNATPVATNSVKANIAEIAAGNGYTAGGVTVPVTSSTQTSGTYSLVMGADPVITATGAIGPFRYVVFYNDTSASDNLIQWYDYGSTITMASGDTLTIDCSTLRSAT
jgi:hypothetical protein